MGRAGGPAGSLFLTQAGLAGALYAHYVLTLTPSIVDFSEMARIIVMVVIGGLGSFIAPIIGAPPVYADVERDDGSPSGLHLVVVAV